MTFYQLKKYFCARSMEMEIPNVIIWLQYYIGGEGSLGTPKSDYVICARPLIICDKILKPERNNSWSTKMSSTIRFGEYKILHFKFKVIVAFLQSVNLCQRKNVVVGVVDIVHWTTGQTFLWTDTQHHLFMWLWELGKKIEVDGWGMRSLYGIDEGAVLYLNWCVHGVTASVSKHWLDYTFTNTSYVRRFKKCQWWWL